ncbi:Putative acetyl-hydrolase LipR precursor [Acinetobacter calcoaceticus]|uniref:Acetyl-hydrolase LipR n=1 Tax=Acinetobacter calcoaceticus TaxID=471 RepID=A0A446ZLH7_ACICA|nr:alpha/beta hydrolase [Acinetobacter calcoaceticus]VAX45348.1 Putative acetyl-hydrolase LipR precursor [Acinetobacter calcoaceticus]
MKQLLAWTIRTTLRPALSPKIPVKLQRFCSDAASAIVRGPRGYKTQKQSIAQVPTLHILPKSTKNGLGILYLHGGGYVVGSSKSHSKLAAQIGHVAQAQVWLPEYRLAPEHASPAAIEDVIAVYKALLAQGQDPKKLVIAGDSAGGGLSLSTAIAIRDSGLPLPAALVLLSPWVDLSLSGKTMKTHAAQDAMLSEGWLSWCAKNYCGQKPTTDPICSPLYADLTGLPPVLIHVGTEEVLLDDAKRLAEQTGKYGIPMSFKVYDQVGHVFQFHAGILKESDDSIEHIGQFIHKYAQSI